jgi:hypothetical protein
MAQFEFLTVCTGLYFLGLLRSHPCIPWLLTYEPWNTRKKRTSPNRNGCFSKWASIGPLAKL